MSFSLQIPVPAIRGHFGRESLYTFQTQVRPDQIINLLGHDPRGQNWRRLPKELFDLYSKIQRKTSKGRRESVEGYLEDRLVDMPRPGAFPAICIGLTRPAAFEEGENQKLKDMGLLQIDVSPSNIRVLLDGLARVSGTLGFQEERADMIEAFTMPVTIFAPHERHRELTLEELGQLFFDFNFRVNPISKSHGLRLDQSDIYLVLANKLGRSETLEKYGGMEVGRQSLGKKSKGIVVQQVLFRFARGACEGGTFQKSNNATVENPNLTRESFAAIHHELETFIENFEAAMGQERFGDRSSVHLTSSGWQALGLVAHDLYFELRDLDAVDRARIVKEVGTLDWSRNNADMIRIGVLSMVDGQIGLSGRGVAAVEALHDYIHQQTSLGKRLEQVQAAAQSA
jgi:DGQHR domain-containing protein